MAQAQQPDDFEDDIQDPDAVQADVTAGLQNNIGRAQNSFQLGNAVTQQGGNLLGQGYSQMTGNQNVGDPRVVEARKISGAMKQIIQASDAEAPDDETPLQKQQRLAQSIAVGMANVSPAIALKANMQAVAMQEAQTQQRLINAQVTNTQAEGSIRGTQAAMDQVGANYQVHGIVTGKDGLPIYKTVGDAVPLFNDDGTLNPNFHQQIQTNLSQAKAQGIDSPQFTTVDKFQNAKDQVAMLRAQATAAAADRKAAAQSSGGLTPDGLKQIMVESALDNSALSRQPPATRNAVANLKASLSISPADEYAARSQIKALNASAVAIGTRAGNIDILSKSVGGMGDQVLQTLDKVDRTRYPVLNAGIIIGKNAAGNADEARYSAAMQTFVNEYGRVIAGGTGISTDAARKEATDLLKTSMSPAAVKGVIDQLSKKELSIVSDASDQAVELVANPKKYSAIMKIQNAAGLPLLSDAEATYNRSMPAVSRPGQGSGTPPAPSSGWGVAKAN